MKNASRTAAWACVWAIAASGGIAGAAEQIRLDFEAPGSATWPKFISLGPRKIYTPAARVGWKSAADLAKLRAVTFDGPDRLTGDCIEVRGAATLVVDLDLSDYKLWALLGEPPDVGEASEIAFKGGPPWRRELTERAYHSDQGLYRLRAARGKPNADLFESIVVAAHAEFTADFSGAGPRTEIRLTNVAICSLVLAPASAGDGFQSALDGIREKRKQELTGRIVAPPRPKPPPTPDKEEIDRGYFLFVRPIGSPIYPNSRPSADERRKQIILSAARGETVSVSLGILPFREGLSKITATPQALTGPEPGAFPAGSVQVRRVRYSLRPVGGGKYREEPFLLEPSGDAPLVKDRAASFWLTIPVPVRTPPGRYSGELLLDAAGVLTRMKLHLTVNSMELLEDTKVVTAFRYVSPTDRRWNYRDDSFQARAEVRRGRIEKELSQLLRHGANAVFMPTPEAIRRENGSLLWDISARSQDVLEAAQAAGYREDAPLIWDGEEAAGRIEALGIDASSEAFENEWLRFLRLAATWTSRTGRSGYVIVADRIEAAGRREPGADGKRIALLTRASKGESRLKRVLALDSDQLPGLETEPEDLLLNARLDVVVVPPTKAARRFAAETEKAGPPELWYGGAGNERLVFGLYPWTRGVTGLLGLSYQRHARPYYPFGNDGGYAFPSPDGPVATIPFEMARIGINDRRYVRTLEYEIEMAKDAKGTDARKLINDGRAMLDQIRKMVPRYVDPDLSGGGVRPAQIDAWRPKLTKHIEWLRSLRSAEVPKPTTGTTASVPSNETKAKPNAAGSRRKRMILGGIILGVAVLLVIVTVVLMRKKE